MSELTAYEKMFKDGSAFKKIDMNSIGRQMNAEAARSAAAGGKDISAPLGDPVDKTPIKTETYNNNLAYDDTDWSDVDAGMQRRMNSLRSKLDNGTQNKSSLNENKRIAILEKKVKKLEEAVILIMEAHEQTLTE